jgi:CBS domain-containing protein
MKAEEIMTTNVVTIRPSATVKSAIKLMREKNLRSIIVDRRHDQDAYGIISETDVVYKVTAYGKDPSKVKVYEVMSKPCIVVNPELEVEYVARLFANTRIHQAPVIKDKLIGVVTINDILHKGDFLDKPKEVTLEEQIEKARLSARQICAERGATSNDCAAAWDIVEELQAELAHQKAQTIEKTYFEQYCEENPSAFEARIYDS